MMDDFDGMDEHDDAIEHDLDITLTLPLDDGWVDEPAPQASTIGLTAGFVMDIHIQSDNPAIGDKIREASDRIEKG